MKAGYCVDYLSHQWSKEEDLIETYKETIKEFQKNHRSKYMKEKKFNNSDYYKLIRYKNALWRSMSTKSLIDPSIVGWQKESDITWLYGPMYTLKSSCQQQQSSINSFSSLQVLKPVLKSKSNVTQAVLVLPSYSDPEEVEVEECYHSTRSYSRNASFSSSSSSSVHFNPEIIEIEYQPEYPVSFNHYQEQEEDDILWSLVIQFIASLNHQFSSLFIFKYLLFYQNLLFLPLLWFNKKRNTTTTNK